MKDELMKMDGNNIDELFKGTLKIVTKDFVIYNREWLRDNIDMEAEQIKNYDKSTSVETLFEHFKEQGGCKDCALCNPESEFSNTCQQTLGWAVTCKKFITWLGEQK